MPSGKTHAAACAAVAVGAGSALYFSNLASLINSCYVFLGALAGIMISPDLDLMENGNYSMVILRKRSHLLAQIWRLFWWPYAKMSRHRGMSHWPIIGTFLRLMYILVVVVIFTTILFLLGIRVPLVIHTPIAFICGGLMLSDIAHVILDVIF